MPSLPRGPYSQAPNAGGPPPPPRTGKPGRPGPGHMSPENTLLLLSPRSLSLWREPLVTHKIQPLLSLSASPLRAQPEMPACTHASLGPARAWPRALVSPQNVLLLPSFWPMFSLEPLPAEQELQITWSLLLSCGRDTTLSLPGPAGPWNGQRAPPGGAAVRMLTVTLSTGPRVCRSCPDAHARWGVSEAPGSARGAAKLEGPA